MSTADAKVPLKLAQTQLHALFKAHSPKATTFGFSPIHKHLWKLHVHEQPLRSHRHQSKWQGVLAGSPYLLGQNLFVLSLGPPPTTRGLWQQSPEQALVLNAAPVRNKTMPLKP